MADGKELIKRVEDKLRPVFLEFKDEGLLGLISQRIIDRARIIDSLDSSYPPMDGLVQDLYGHVERDILRLGENLISNPEGTRSIIQTENLEVERYRILRKVAETLIIQAAKGYYSRFGLQDFSHPRMHFAHGFVESFSAVREVVGKGEADIGIAIGPEGFMYAAMFELLGFPLRNIHIDEYSRAEDRPYKELDDLSAISGKDVLFIEDDVKTGATLRKAHQNIGKYSPASVSVYLGIPEPQQTLQNVPKDFRNVYTVPHYLGDKRIKEEVDALIEILGKKYSIFKKK